MRGLILTLKISNTKEARNKFPNRKLLAINFILCCVALFMSVENSERITNQILELLKGQTYSFSEEVLKNCLLDLKEKSKVV